MSSDLVSQNCQYIGDWILIIVNETKNFCKSYEGIWRLKDVFNECANCGWQVN